MIERPRVALLASNHQRHRFFAEQLAAGVDLLGVVMEGKPPPMATVPDDTSAIDRAVIAEHFAERDEVERKFFVTTRAPLGEVHEVSHGGVSDPETVQWLDRLRPDYVMVYGSSIIRQPLLDIYSGRMINLHLGLSPYYRGSATNFWPFVQREPECVGATIHLITAKIDAGPILAQVRPSAEATDRIHDLGCKTVIAAARVLPRLLSELHAGRLESRSQDLSQGRVWRRKDFNADAVRTAWRNLDSGMMAEYLADAGARRARFPIVEPDALSSEMCAASPQK